MTGGQTPSQIVRMNPLISPVRANAAAPWGPPSMTAEQFSYLVNLDMDAVDQVQVDAISQCAELWIAGKVANQPIRMNGDTLEPEIGDVGFAAARASWEHLKLKSRNQPAPLSS
jgi:hypothetical protein